jgi:hypothetical protein
MDKNPSFIKLKKKLKCKAYFDLLPDWNINFAENGLTIFGRPGNQCFGERLSLPIGNVSAFIRI